MATKKDDMALDPELVELAAGTKKKKGEKQDKGDKVQAKAEKAEKAAAKAEEAPKAEKAPEKVAEEPPKPPEPKVSCFISRKEYPISETVELKYKTQTVRVAKNLVKFQTA